MSRASPRLPPGEVQAWYAPTTALAAPGRLERALAWLGSDERIRYDRFRGDVDRQMFLLGRVMARALVSEASGVEPAAWQWREGPHGRPEIAAPSTSLQFNLAHSAGLVVCALAVGRDVGVDVEDLLRRPIEPALVDRYCSPDETADVSVGADGWHRRFLTYWTLKEAYLKARGLGISVHLADISFSVGAAEPRISFRESLVDADTRWRFHLAQPTERHLVALAASAADGVRPPFTLTAFDDGRW